MTGRRDTGAAAWLRSAGNETRRTMTTLLEAGGALINPSALRYAVVETDSEGLALRLGFAPEPNAGGELRLTGLEARTVLRWLRRNVEICDPGAVSPGRGTNCRLPPLAAPRFAGPVGRVWPFSTTRRRPLPARSSIEVAKESAPVNRKAIGIAALLFSLAFGCGSRESPPAAGAGRLTAVDASLPKEAQARQSVVRDLLNNLQEGYPAERLKVFLPGVKFRETQAQFLEGGQYLERWSFQGPPAGDEVPVSLVFATEESGGKASKQVDRVYVVQGVAGRYTVSRKQTAARAAVVSAGESTGR
jgi:hypothetical protein